MSRVFYLPQHRTLSTRHPVALRRMRLTGCWVSADERRYWKSRAPHPGFEPPPPVQQAGILTTRPLSCLNSSVLEKMGSVFVTFDPTLVPHSRHFIWGTLDTCGTPVSNRTHSGSLPKICTWPVAQLVAQSLHVGRRDYLGPDGWVFRWEHEPEVDWDTFYGDEWAIFGLSEILSKSANIVEEQPICHKTSFRSWYKWYIQDWVDKCCVP